MNKANDPSKHIKRRVGILLMVALAAPLMGCGGFIGVGGGDYGGYDDYGGGSDLSFFGGDYGRGRDEHGYSHRGSARRGAAHLSGSRGGGGHGGGRR